MPLQTVSVVSDEEGRYSYGTSFTSVSSVEEKEAKVMRDEVEELRDIQYPQLKDKVYLDHAGTTLYAKALIDTFSTDLVTNLYGNPHSESTPSAFAGERIDQIREQALRFLNADPKHWDLIFVANATAAIKLTVECFRDYAASRKHRMWYGYHKDAHTSLVGGRSMADSHHCFTTDEEVDNWIQNGCKPRSRRHRDIRLFAYPGQSNMTGRRLPLEWCTHIRSVSSERRTYTLLDAAALATTAPLRLENPHTSPDFVALSFYKIFGFPNLGALLVQKDCRHILEGRKYFGGGTVEMVISIGQTWHAKKDATLHDQLEDGTLPFHAIFALGHAMTTHELLYGVDPMSRISRRTAGMIKVFYESLSQLRHSNGQPMIRIYKDARSKFGDASTQGATIALNVLRSDGSMVGYADVEKDADELGIYVRSGSLCNPGGLATHLQWTPRQMKKAYAEGHRCSDPIQTVFGKPTGVVRVSLGAMSTLSDVQAFVNFVALSYRDTTLCKEDRLSIIAVRQVDLCVRQEPQVDARNGLSKLRTLFRCWGA